MASYSIELSDDMALRLSGQHNAYGLVSPADGINPEWVSENLAAMVARYAGFPETVDDRHRAAMAICRSLAAERAAQSGNKDRLESGAESILRFMLGGW